MNGKEKGFLLLTCRLGDENRQPLTTAQVRILTQRVRKSVRVQGKRDLEVGDILALGYSEEMARRIVSLMDDNALLDTYLRCGRQMDCYPISRISEAYPMAVHNRLGADAPGSLWAKGELSLLELPGVSLVGSRDIGTENLRFAQQVGMEAARQGFVLVSGNARGADRAAQDACLEAGGKVICVVADELQRQPLRKNVLYLSEDGFDLGFTAQRALSRNRVIHCMGLYTFVAQCSYQRGGTWDGTVKNLRFGWSPVFCYQDGSAATALLENMGARGIDMGELHDFTKLNG